MGTIILTHMLTSLNNLLFTRGEERFIQGRFNLNQQKFLLIQIKPLADVTNFEGSQLRKRNSKFGLNYAKA